MSNPTEGQAEIRVNITWDRVNGTLTGYATGDPAHVVVDFHDDERYYPVLGLDSATDELEDEEDYDVPEDPCAGYLVPGSLDI